MKSRSKEMLDRAKAAMVAAVEIYNKPGFSYRAETFVILAINGWELLLKAKCLLDHDNRPNCLYVYETREVASGKKGKKKYIKRTEAKNPFTHGLGHLGAKACEKHILNPLAWNNIKAIQEIRDSAVHFYNQDLTFRVRLQEIGAACVKNFTAAVQEWFGENLSEFNLYLMPLAFVDLPDQLDGIVLNAEEKNLLRYLNDLDSSHNQPDSNYSVTINVEIKFTRSKAKNALQTQIVNDSNAQAVRLTEEQVRERYPWGYQTLTNKCKEKFTDFKVDSAYHEQRKKLQSDVRFGTTRFLDPEKPEGQKKTFFNPNIMKEFEKIYKKQR